MFTVPALAKSAGLVKFRPSWMVKLPVAVLLEKLDRASNPASSTKLEFGPSSRMVAALFTISPPVLPRGLICKVPGEPEVP